MRPASAAQQGHKHNVMSTAAGQADWQTAQRRTCDFICEAGDELAHWDAVVAAQQGQGYFLGQGPHGAAQTHTHAPKGSL